MTRDVRNGVVKRTGVESEYAYRCRAGVYADDDDADGVEGMQEI